MRLAFILLSFAWGIGVILYGVLWLVMAPDGPRDVSDVRRTARRNLGGFRSELSSTAGRLSSAWNRTESSGWPRPLDRRWIAIGLVALGGLVLLTSFGAFAWLTPVRAIGLAAVVVGIGLLVTLGTR